MKIKLSLVSIILVYASSIYSMTPQQKLSMGAANGNIELVEEALKAGADVNSQNYQGLTALMKAAYKGHNSIVKQLLLAGADVNAKNAFGDTALRYAADNCFRKQKEHSLIVKYLIEAGADVNLKDSHGFTALIYAVNNGNIEMVEELLKAGADISIKNDIGKTAIDMAKKYNRTEIVKLLEEYLEKQKAAIQQYLPLPSVLQDVTAEYLGYPKVMKKKKM